jgi:geranylgeranyl diphosphate synthase type I
VSHSDLSAFLGHWLPRLEAELRDCLRNDDPTVAAHYQMMHYHMGWVDEHFLPYGAPAGKRLRPMLCLLACAELGGDAVQALPAAAAIEIVHNFSLIHDDIEDGDEVRRHRPTVWKVWGVPQAVNVGDAMYTLAYAALHRLSRLGVPAETVLRVLDCLTKTCLALTEGQHLDMRFETRNDVTVAEYLCMIGGKTAALVGASVAVGGIIAGASPSVTDALSRYGEAIGLAFQIQDDRLGIWGDPEVTGKPAGNDLLRRKKSLPILHALNHERVGEQFETLLASEVAPGHLGSALRLLDQAGTLAYVASEERRQYEAGLSALHEALGERANDSALFALAESLLHRVM